MRDASPLTFAEIDARRRAFHRSVLLYITDRCPVGCGHCSVDSRADSPTITDWATFETIVNEIGTLPQVELVGISGGEPFAERRGLELAVSILQTAGKFIVLYTSGVWARTAVPSWAKGILRAADAIFLSTDAFHEARIEDETFIRAARAIVAEDCWLIIQAIAGTGVERRVAELMATALGAGWADFAELNLTQPLPYGRGAEYFEIAPSHQASDFGPCSVVAAPVVRYDGSVTACCNEQVITGGGPASLHIQRRDVSLDETMQLLADDPLVEAIYSVGPGPLTLIPNLSHLAEKRFRNICDACWKVFDAIPSAEAGEHQLVRAISLLSGGSSDER